MFVLIFTQAGSILLFFCNIMYYFCKLIVLKTTMYAQSKNKKWQQLLPHRSIRDKIIERVYGLCEYIIYPNLQETINRHQH